MDWNNSAWLPAPYSRIRLVITVWRGEFKSPTALGLNAAIAQVVVGIPWKSVK